MDVSNLSLEDEQNATPSTRNHLPSKPPVTRMEYFGRHGELLKIHLVNLFLNIITIGIYSFWGKTRIRRYMTSHITLKKDRFEYTGTGKELLIGWLKAMVIFLPLIIALSIPVVNFIAFPIFFGILSIAIFLALRYRLSRSRWRGIRFNLGGSIKEYFVLSLIRTGKNIISLGWRIPKSDIVRWTYIANHMTYGDLKFSYNGDYKRLQKIHAITLGIFIASMIVGFSFLFMSGFTQSMERLKDSRATQGQTVSQPELQYDEEGYPIIDEQTQSDVVGEEPKLEKSMVVGIILMYVGIGIGFLGRMWYQAALWQEKFRGLRLANLRFKSDVTGKGLAKLFITNMLIIIFSLGLAKPIALQRTLKYYIANMRLAGDLDELIAKQREAQEKSGMGDALAADVGFDMGM
jgi:uncharacterized membrane protein YjgN (DUF898 family)